MGAVDRKLGRRVAELRKAATLTQAELAERLGVSTETVSRMERGAAMPSLSAIERVAKELGVDLSELFRFRPSNSPRDIAVEGLLNELRGRPAEDVQVVAEIAGRMFARWPVGTQALVGKPLRVGPRLPRRRT